MMKKNKTYFISLVVVMLLLTISITYAQTNNNVNISYSTGLYIADGQSPIWNVSLPNSVINSTAPSGGYTLTFSWGANNGSNIMRPGGGAFTPTATFGIRVNGVQYWQAKTPNDSNTESGDNGAFNGASFVSGVTGVWNMESNASLSNTASIRLPSGVTSITSIQLYGFTGSGGSGGDDFILQLNSLVANSCSAGVTAPSLSTNVSVLCPNTTTNLSSITASNTPSGAVLTWHTAPTAPTANTANKITNTVVGAGTYYAAFFDSANNCYSPTALVTVTASVAGTVAPTLSSTTKVGVCSLTTVDLTSITASNLPAGTVLTWHTGSSASGTNKVANPTAVGAGTYYASFFDSANNCYSPTALVTAIVTGTVAPTLSSTTKVGVCPSTTVDLTSITASNLPAGTVLTWHTGSSASGTNKVANPTAVGVGTYYASFFDSANNCYSPTSTVTATAASCASGVINCSKTQLYPAAVVGVASQKILYITLNVSTSGCFTPLIVSGSGFSVANGISEICTTSTGVQQLALPVNYDGSALSNVNFTIGSAGSCSADLTKSPKKAIVDMWTLDCVPTSGPGLK